MADQLQFRRGSTAQTATFTGAIGEVTVDTSKNTVVVHDGATAGGFPALTESDKIELLDGSKNVLIGNFRVNQREVSGTVGLLVGEYGHDRFRAGSGGCTYTFSTTSGVTEISISSGTIEQEVEGDNLQTGDYILSWSGTAQGQVDGGGFGTTGVSGALVGGTNSSVDWGSGTLSLTQLEKGSIATSFDHRIIGEELSLCQRYFFRPVPGDSSTFAVLSEGYWTGTDRTITTIHLPVTMRAVPTLSIDGAASQYALNTGGTFATATPTLIAIEANSTTVDKMSLHVEVFGSSETPGISTRFLTIDTNTTDSIGINAEL